MHTRDADPAGRGAVDVVLRGHQPMTGGTPVYSLCGTIHRDMYPDAVEHPVIDGVITPVGVVLPDGWLLLDVRCLWAVRKHGLGGDDDDLALGT